MKDKGVICEDCAIKLGGKWPKDHKAAWWCDVCPYCHRERALCPTGAWGWDYYKWDKTKE